MNPATVHEALQLLRSYHQRRRKIYRKLAASATDERTQILLQELIALEDRAIQIVGDEDQDLGAAANTYLLPGPTLIIDPDQGMEGLSGPQPTFDEILFSSLSSDAALDELIDLIAGSTAAASIQDLAQRLREHERTKDRQIANFTRKD